MGVGALSVLAGALLSVPAPGRALFGPGAHLAPGARFTPAAGATAPGLTLGVSAFPRVICAYGLDTCGAGTGASRVTLSATAGAGIPAWPDVQVAFVLETTPFDGVYHPGAGEPGASCANGASGMPCEESNGVPFFVANAQAIANAIQQANPRTHVSFAMVDYFATVQWNDGDGLEYHVDIPSFVPPGQFGADVQSTFQTGVLTVGNGWSYFDSDLADNFLHSSSITALYGTIIGSGLNWGNNTHHVIVWIGSTAPRDPSYPENYCVSPSALYLYGAYSSCFGETCEPSYHFGMGVSSNCEGWVHSSDGNATHSIAALARTAPQCTDSVGRVCTIDAIDLYNTPTDPFSKDWPSGRTGGGPGGPLVLQDVNNILRAGCDISAATNGSWNGPAWYSCPDGRAGTLQYYDHGPWDRPNLANPPLFEAIRSIGFGPVLDTQVAASRGHPLFQFVPFGNIALAPGDQLQATAACYRAGVPFANCQVHPNLVAFAGIHLLEWNWSTVASSNTLFAGDEWTASFNVQASGPPYTLVPVDACVTALCRASGSGPNVGLYTSATYVPYTNSSLLTESFPLAQVTVEYTPSTALPPGGPPPPPPPPPGFAIPNPIPNVVGQLVGIGNTIGLTSLSLQAVGAGFLGAGFMRVSLKNRPIAMRVAAKSGVVVSKFDKPASADAGIGRFE